MEEMCRKVDVEPALPRRCGRQRHRDNNPAETPLDYYRCTVSIGLVDHLLVELRARFTAVQKSALQGLCLVPSVLVSMPQEDVQDKVMKFAQVYKTDLASLGSVKSEVHCWYTKWRRQRDVDGQDSLPTTPTLALRHATAMFPNLCSLLKVLCTLPVTTCTAERSFSGLKRIKSVIRATMGNQRLTGLAMMHMHRDMNINTSSIIDEFARRHPRRLEMVNMLLD